MNLLLNNFCCFLFHTKCMYLSLNFLSNMRSPAPGQNIMWFFKSDYRRSQRLYLAGLMRESCLSHQTVHIQYTAVRDPWQVLLFCIFEFLAQIHSFIPFIWGLVQKSSRSLCWGLLLCREGGGKTLRTTFSTLTHYSVVAIPSPSSLPLPQP